MSADQIYALPLKSVGDFEFDEQVVRVFPDMISRSVPGYASILSMIGELSATYATPGSSIYDLGCSLGAATFVMRVRVPGNCTIHAIDSSAAMLRRLKELHAAQPQLGCHITVAEADIRSAKIEQASFAVLNFTLQFIDPHERQDVLRRVCDGMLPGGCLVLSEKICFDDPSQQVTMTELHHAFKRANGYSDLEIAQKRAALEKIMIPETLDAHVGRLESVGFSTVVPWFQCFNFTSLLAIK